MSKFSLGFDEGFYTNREPVNIKNYGFYDSFHRSLSVYADFYGIVHPLFIPNDVESITGNGRTLSFSPDIEGPLIYNDSVRHFLKIKDLRIDGNYFDGPMGSNASLDRELAYGIRIINCRNLVVEGCEIENIAGMGCSPVGCSNVVFNQNKVYNVGRDGFTAYAKAKSIKENGVWKPDPAYNSVVINSLLVTNNNISETGDDCIAVQLSNDTLLCKHAVNRNIDISNNFLLTTNQHSDKISARGIFVGGADGVIIAHNRIRNAPVDGIMVMEDLRAIAHGEDGERSRGVVITGNTIRNTGKYQGSIFNHDRCYGIFCRNTDVLNITSNTIDRVFDSVNTGFSGMGIDYNNCYKCNVNNNVEEL